MDAYQLPSFDSDIPSYQQAMESRALAPSPQQNDRAPSVAPVTPPVFDPIASFLDDAPPAAPSQPQFPAQSRTPLRDDTPPGSGQHVPLYQQQQQPSVQQRPAQLAAAAAPQHPSLAQYQQNPSQTQQQPQYYQQPQVGQYQMTTAPPQQLSQQKPAVDPIQSLLERYPNPQTEQEKLRKALENMAVQIQSYMKRMDRTVEVIDQRLTDLEEVTKDLLDQTKASPTKLKKKKRRSGSAYERDPRLNTVDDEEIARRLQQQLNAEAEAQSITQALSDEEYAKRLQALYLKRDISAATRRKKKDEKKKEEQKKAEEQQQKPSLWSRLFGGATADAEDEDSDEGLELKQKSKEPKKSEPAKTTPTVLPTAVPPTGMPPIYGYYGHPQQPPMMYPAGTIPYIPMSASGSAPPYYMPGQPHTNPQ